LWEFAMPTDSGEEMPGTETPPTDANAEVAEIERRPDLVWDNEAHGLCMRVYGDRATSFIFVYRIAERQRFIRLGKTPVWSLKTARKRAKELRSMVDQGQDPAGYIPEPTKIEPVENVIRYISEHLQTEP
jgi:Arm DNA-binding domain